MRSSLLSQRLVVRALVSAASLLATPGLAACAGDGLRQAAALSDEVRRAASEEAYWPGFDPAAVPLAVFDGATTYLFRHPAPPEGFVGEAGALAWDGRYPSVVANSSAQLGGTQTATVMLQSFPEEYSLREQAAVVIHEAFHVFQGTTQRRWGANEVDLFLYPVDDASILTLRRLETEALRRAITALDPNDAAAWAREALELRRERFERMEPSFPAYERGIESQEGTAAYIQHRVSGGQSRGLLDTGFEADDVRSHAYRTGVALALLLDQFAPGWQAGFGEDGSRFLDSDLAQAVGTAQEAHDRSFTQSEREEAMQRASTDVDAMVSRRTELREQFLSKPGWRVVFETQEGSPLWPQEFDPLNIKRVDGGILHTRFLRVGSEAGMVEVMGGGALTEGVGPHPLFDGVRRVFVTGLRASPMAVVDGARVIVTTPSCVADLLGAVASLSDSTLTVYVGDTKAAPNEPGSRRSN